MNGLYEEIRLALHAIWQRRWIALATAWAIALVGWLVVAMIPNSYQSEARVFVQMQSILPDKLGMVQGDRQRDIDRVRQTLASTVNLEKVVRGTDLSLRATSDKDVANMAAGLRKNITIVSQQDNLFQITAKYSGGGMSDSENAKLAKAIVQKLIDIFVEENMADGRTETSQTIRFLDQQLAERGAALQQAEAKKAEFEGRYLGMLPGSGSIEQRMDAARSEMSDIETQLISAQSALSAVNGQMAGTPATVSTPNIVINSGNGGGGALAGVEAQIAEGQSRGWTEQHPDMIGLRQQLARLKASGAGRATGGGGGGSTSAANPLYMSLRSMQAERQATVAGLSTRRAQLQAALNQYASAKVQNPDAAAALDQADRDYQVLKAQYDKLLQDREEVKVRADAQTETDAVRFRVIDPPSDPRVPIAPNRPLLLTVVLIVALAGGAGAAFAKSQVQTTFATASRLARASGLPVIGSISQIWTPAQRIERRKRLMWFAGGSGGLAAAFVVLLTIEFVQRGMVA
jgi:polysaccharide chain length determinant protein (PEP-CTERM system associated)